MIFERKDLHLVEAKTVVTQKGSEMIFVKLADKVTYDTAEISLAKNHETVIAGKSYDVLLSYDGKWASVTLTPTGKP